jgi:hypothetical protein
MAPWVELVKILLVASASSASPLVTPEIAPHLKTMSPTFVVLRSKLRASVSPPSDFEDTSPVAASAEGFPLQCNGDNSHF